MIDVNIHGVLYGIAAVLPEHDGARRSGHIVNVASIGAHVVVPTAAVYCATKYAVWAISDGPAPGRAAPCAMTVDLARRRRRRNSPTPSPTRRRRQVMRRLPPRRHRAGIAIARAIAFAIAQPA